ncbi:hypothetical protein PMI30_05228 [Pseudomonas sp. GM50]|uniref:hypothetical protein n=1 Tax=Pseudomonas sp. GM50 TaxID=1144332 RepID=UPI0002709954|nr:hypothetical protein [Pseudomonas sp. GM50]EJM61476.1 hypothetical protein PMI30_05228 [Pseudomonas sp. GM50]
MSASKFGNLTMTVTDESLHVAGRGPSNKKVGAVSFFYENGASWSKFGKAWCGSWENNDPPELMQVDIQRKDWPKGSVKVVVCWTSDGVPPNESASDLVSVSFPS